MNKIFEFISGKIIAFVVFAVVMLSVKGFNYFYAEEIGITFLLCFLGVTFLGYDYEIIKNEVIKNWHAKSINEIQTLKDGSFLKYVICAVIFSLVYNFVGANFFDVQSWYEVNSIIFGAAFFIGAIGWILLKMVVMPYVTYRIAKKAGEQKKLFLSVIIGIIIVIVITYLKNNVLPF